MAEKSKHSVSAYGGLGAKGLDFGEAGFRDVDKIKEIEGSFSGSAAHLAPKFKMDEDSDSMLNDDNLDDLEDIPLDMIEDEQEIEDIDDSAPYPIPKEDSGYYQVLEERFGHTSFYTGQLRAIKLILESKKNCLVVLATGGGKSLCYQYTTQFLPGLVLVVTPLISLMTDQLQKLPDFIPGAALNS